MHRTGVQKEKVTFEKKIVWKENCYKLVVVHSSYQSVFIKCLLSSPIFIMTFIMVFLFFFFSLKLFCMICIFFLVLLPMTKNRIYVQNQVWFEAFFVMIAFA